MREWVTSVLISVNAFAPVFCKVRLFSRTTLDSSIKLQASNYLKCAIGCKPKIVGSSCEYGVAWSTCGT